MLSDVKITRRDPSKLPLWVSSHKKTFILFLCLYALLAVVALQSRYRIGWQYDKSVDFTFAIVDRGDKEVKYGKYYAFVFHSQGHPRDGRDFVKKAVCLPGEDLASAGQAFFCNGMFFATALDRDSKGKVLQKFKYSGIVPQNMYFVIGDHAESFDSRYWGFVDRQWIIGRVYPLF